MLKINELNKVWNKKIKMFYIKHIATESNLKTKMCSYETLKVSINMNIC